MLELEWDGAVSKIVPGESLKRRTDRDVTRCVTREPRSKFIRILLRTGEVTEKGTAGALEVIPREFAEAVYPMMPKSVKPALAGALTVRETVEGRGSDGSDWSEKSRTLAQRGFEARGAPGMLLRLERLII